MRPWCIGVVAASPVRSLPDVVERLAGRLAPRPGQRGATGFAFVAVGIAGGQLRGDTGTCLLELLVFSCLVES